MKKIYLILSMVIAFQSCTTAIIDELDPNSLPPIQRTITYSSDVQAIMFNYCATCHAGSTPIGGFTLETYSNVRFYTESGSLLDRINNVASPMPPSGLMPADQRQIIEKWVTDGYLEN